MSKTTEEVWEGDGLSPSRRLDAAVVTGVRHVGTVLVIGGFVTLLLGLFVLVGLDKITPADLQSESRLIAIVFVVALLIMEPRAARALVQVGRRLTKGKKGK